MVISAQFTCISTLHHLDNKNVCKSLDCGMVATPFTTETNAKNFRTSWTYNDFYSFCLSAELSAISHIVLQYQHLGPFLLLYTVCFICICIWIASSAMGASYFGKDYVL